MFDEQDSRYKCCCSHMHVKTGSLIIIILECVGVVMTVIAALAGSGGAIDIVGSLIGVAIIILLIYAMKKENAVFVLPHLVFQGIIVVALVVIAIGHMSDALSITGKMDEALETKGGGGVNATNLSSRQQQQIIATGGGAIGLLVFLAIILFACAALEAWFFLILLGLYRYYKEKRQAGLTSDVGSTGFSQASTAYQYNTQTTGYQQSSGGKEP
uniref:Uncharacterized protein n=1 Tax=Romanomermis culicivorax TaxID=13658 RepID=A0A915HNI6_ROMCU